MFLAKILLAMFGQKKPLKNRLVVIHVAENFFTCVCLLLLSFLIEHMAMLTHSYIRMMLNISGTSQVWHVLVLKDTAVI